MAGIYAVNTISFTGSSRRKNKKSSNSQKTTLADVKKAKSVETRAENRTQEEKKKEAAKKAVEGGGAVAATAKLTSNKKAGVDFFTKASEASGGMKKSVEALKTASETAKKSTSLWSKCANAVKSTKASIIEWGSTVKANRLVKPLLASKAFRYFAGFLGYGFGVVTLITGAGDIVDVANDAVNGKFSLKNSD